jgi:hypothetical protein
VLSSGADDIVSVNVIIHPTFHGKTSGQHWNFFFEVQIQVGAHIQSMKNRGANLFGSLPGEKSGGIFTTSHAMISNPPIITAHHKAYCWQEISDSETRILEMCACFVAVRSNRYVNDRTPCKIGN